MSSVTIARVHRCRVTQAHNELTIIAIRSSDTFADMLNRARTDTGLAVTSRRVARERLVGDRWITWWGISLQPLTTGRAER